MQLAYLCDEATSQSWVLLLILGYLLVVTSEYVLDLSLELSTMHF